MVGNDVPIDVLLDRTVQQLEHAEAVNAQLLTALERVRAKIYYDNKLGNNFVLVDEETFAMIEQALADSGGMEAE